MTTEKFIKAIEDYYGEYRPMVKVVVAKYVHDLYPESRQELFNRITREQTGRYNFVPDLAVIRQTWRGIKEERLHDDEAALVDRRILQIEGPTDEHDIEDMREELAKLREHLQSRLKPARAQRKVKKSDEFERIKLFEAWEEVESMKKVDRLVQHE